VTAEEWGAIVGGALDVGSTVYALDAALDLPEGSTKASLEAEIEKHLIEKAELIGLYGR